MTQPFSIGHIDVELTSTGERAEGPPDPDTPFRILLLGDFTRRRGRPAATPRGDADPVRVDRDNVDDVITRLAPELELDFPGAESGRLALRFRALEDFHPDHLFEALDVFRTLRSARGRLNDPDAFKAAAAEVRAWMGTDVAAPPRPAPTRSAEAELSEGQRVMRELIESSEQRGTAGTRSDEGWRSFVRGIVAPHLVAREDPQRPALLAAVDRASAAAMRAVLHHPDFQALESAWRAVDFLVRRLETGTELQLYLLDLPRADLAAAVEDSDGSRARALHRILVEAAAGTLGGVPWAVVAGNYTFGPGPKDVAALEMMARLAREAGAPFVAAASPRLVGSDSLAATPDPHDWRRADDAETAGWRKLRTSADVAHVGLALPRFLLRLPYGKDSDPLETFAFEELPASPAHDHYLWGNPAFACVALLGDAFSKQGWALRPGAVQEIADLPLYVEERDGDRRVKPCAETLLTVRAAEIILERGLMPLLSFKDGDVVRLARFQSIRDPLTSLRGRWR
ncbi:MAG TPA: type VI secretion system contractile sheath large subunit [Methylomirabilota bacterium]